MSDPLDRSARPRKPRSLRRADVRVVRFPPGSSPWPRPHGAIMPAGREGTAPTAPRPPSPASAPAQGEHPRPPLRLIRPRAD